MRYLTATLFSFFYLTSYGQTKLISFKSHSGNIKNFRTAIEKDFYDINRSNFGVFYHYTYKIDTVVFSKNKVVVFKQRISWNGSEKIKTISQKEILNQNDTKIFLQIKDIDSLKYQLRNKYKGYEVDSLKFIKFNKSN